MMLLHQLASQPWALEEGTLRLLIAHALQQPDGLRARADFQRGAARQGQGGAVAVVGVTGVLQPREDWILELFGGTSTDKLRERIRTLTLDPEVKSIVLDIDSPGGVVQGTEELAQEILAARQIKPVIAQLNRMAASAAYWIAASADEVVATPDAIGGSIGVYRIHEDVSDLLAKRGIAITVIKAGAKKLEEGPFAPLSDDVKAHLQAQVDDAYTSFVSGVAMGRKISPQTVFDRFGQGRTFGAKEMLSRKMIDRVDTFDNTIVRVLGGGRHRPAASSPLVADMFRSIAEIRQALSGPVRSSNFIAELRRDIAEINEIILKVK